jgi:hypothetical protein
MDFDFTKLQNNNQQKNEIKTKLHTENLGNNALHNIIVSTSYPQQSTVVIVVLIIDDDVVVAVMIALTIYFFPILF